MSEKTYAVEDIEAMEEAMGEIDKQDARIEELTALKDELVAALEEIESSGCCQTESCSVENPLCDGMIARAALQRAREVG